MPTIVKHYAPLALKLGNPVEVDPTEALLMALYESYGHGIWLRGKLEEQLGEEEAKRLTQGGGWDGPRPSVFWVMWCEERKQTAKIAETCIKAGIAQRQIELAERQADMIVQVIRAVLNSPELSLTAEQQEAANKVVPAQLRLLKGA